LLLDAAIEKWYLLYTDETRRCAAISLPVVCVDLILSGHVKTNSSMQQNTWQRHNSSKVMVWSEFMEMRVHTWWSGTCLS